MTNDPYNHPLPPAKRPKANRSLGVLLLVAAALIGVCLVLGCVGLITDDRADGKGLTTVVPQPVKALPTSTSTAPAKARALEAGDVKLSVKITKRECFGSAGCLVQFKIKASVDLDVLAATDRDWTVTYEVKGVDDGPQVAELVLHPDGMYDQDGYQAGQTPSRSTKLKATVTDVEPLL
jgi:hypothetical protein